MIASEIIINNTKAIAKIIDLRLIKHPIREIPVQTRETTNKIMMSLNVRFFSDITHLFEYK